VTCGSVSGQLPCFLPQVGTSTSSSHTAQQPPITEAILQQDECTLGWEGTEQREQHPKLLSDTEVKVIGIHMHHGSSHQQGTWLAPLSSLPNSLVSLQGEQATAAFRFCKKTNASKSQGTAPFCERCSTFVPTTTQLCFPSTSPLCGVKDRQAIDTQGGRASVRRVLTKLEDWANNSAVKFSKDKRIALHPEQDNPVHHHSLGSSWLGIWWRTH